jgi:hypothetical protein
VIAAAVVLFATVPSTAKGNTSFAWTAMISPNSTVTTARFDLSFTGLDLNSAIQLTLQPTNLVVGDQFSTVDGNAQFSFNIPAATQPGDYSIRAVGVSNSGSAFTVVVATFAVASTGIVTDSTVRDGVLTLEVPPGASVTFESPVLEDGRSITRGSLSTFVVRDEREASKPGWILNASVSSLMLSSDSSVTMSAAQLGVQPLVISGGNGISAGQATQAGIAANQFLFAEAPEGVQEKITTLGGNLTLLAPPQLPVGTYTGTITLTLMSR